MKLSDAIKKRRSIRRFTHRKVPEKKILKTLEAGLWAPSAGNVQDKEFIIVRGGDLKKEMVSAVFDQVWVAHAPVIVVMVSDINKLRLKFKDRAEFYATISAGAAMQNMLLYLTSKGLQGTHVGLYDESKVKRLLKIPDDKRVFSIIAMGYPGEEPPVPYRMDLKNVTHFEKYGAKWVKKKPRETHLE
ncbi:nitroreductase family protein [archaeon]|nr:nitroreductase family protein [archaeon]